MDVWIIKLGGSIITAKKTGRPAIKKKAIRRLCTEIAQAVSDYPQRRFVLLHGAGSLGHPLVYGHNLKEAKITPQNIQAVSQIIRNMRQLSDALASDLASHRTSPVPLQTSSLLSGKATSHLSAAGIATIHHILRAQGIPILSGDITITDKEVINVVSADNLAMQIAQALSAVKILFASDTPGVYATFPPSLHDQPLPHISRQQLQAVAEEITHSSAKDVTGGMVGKLQALVPLKNVEVSIFDGQKAGNLSAALQSESVGTTIKL